jgi:hypothetical protein
MIKLYRLHTAMVISRQARAQASQASAQRWQWS